ncbi:MAG: PEP-CTERM sorting domain-containing protein [Planctomycetaceae bacterium]|nr:PEP-CTERM sorting domain-containing protein [Planctomycetaceae bacterium]
MKQALTIMALAVVSMLASGAGAALIRIDFGTEDSPVVSGVDALAAAADPVAFGSYGLNVWDGRNAAEYQDTTTNPSFAGLLDTVTGLATSAYISFTGTVYSYNATGWGTGAGNLRGDFLANTVGDIAFEIGGLLANTETKLFVTSQVFTRDGWGEVAGWHDQTASFTIDGIRNNVGNGMLITTTTDGNGRITGTWHKDTGESDLTGIQISQQPIPEPASMGLLVLGGLALLRRRRA